MIKIPTIPKKPSLEDVNKLKNLYFLKRKYLKQLNFEMKIYLNHKKIRVCYEEETGDDFDYNSCTFELYVRRTLAIVYKLDNLIHNLELGEHETDLDDTDSYAKYILLRDHNINVN